MILSTESSPQPREIGFIFIKVPSLFLLVQIRSVTMPKSVADEIATQGHRWHRADGLWRKRKIQGVVGKRAGMQRTSPADCNVCSTVYVGLATVAAATWWFLYDAEGPQVTFYQLVSG